MVAVDGNILRSVVWLVVWLVNTWSQIQIYIEKVHGFASIVNFRQFSLNILHIVSLFAQSVLLIDTTAVYSIVLPIVHHTTSSSYCCHFHPCNMLTLSY